MNAEERTIAKILTEQIAYLIPPYQRPYSWETDNVQQLLDDVWQAFDAKDSEYFIGSLITIEQERDHKYDVVDGQQRLTTLNLVFSSLRDAIEDPNVKADLNRRILPKNPYTGEAETPRLLLRKSDQSFFRKHVLEGKPYDSDDLSVLDPPQRHLIENLEQIDTFWTGKSQQQLRFFANYLLHSVYVVFVTTATIKSAYRLFNVLNARGMQLSNADLIKNTLFGQLGAEANRSTELEERWLELEGKLGIERLDAFLGHHRTSLKPSRPKGTLHEEFDPLIKDGSGGPFEFLDRLIDSADNYGRIADPDPMEVGVLRSLRALHRVDYDEWIPPLLAFFNKPVPGLPEADFIDLLEKITMQNWVRRLGRAARLTAYYQIISAIRDDKSAAEVRQIFLNNANNDEFFQLLGGEVYGMPFDHAVLLRLEEVPNDESVTKSYGGLLTIEHVLPQSLKDTYWQARFSEEQHSQWLHRLGNLAMLCGRKNYKAQYFDFNRKKKIYIDRDKKVSFDLTKEIIHETEWTVDVIRARQERLMKLARQTWTMA